ncbi:MAG: hypothetical protein FWF51_04230 [Chitinivibrionia bacterium]|nr:hypothetical protein [Chitinivibrionia bacterium]
MNWDNLDWDNFSCVEMSRKIKDKMDAEFPTVDALYEHLVKRRQERADMKNATLHTVNQ